MTRREMYELIKSDLNRLGVEKNYIFGGAKCYVLWASFKITYWFRKCSYWHSKHGVFSRLLLAICNLIYKHYQFKLGIDMSYRAKVGKGIKFIHFSGIVVSQDAVIGDNCTIYQCVTIGKTGNKGAPVIGNNCTFYAGAKVLGVKVGDNVEIGANAVVLKDCPDNTIWAGIPAKLLKIKTGKDV